MRSHELKKCFFTNCMFVCLETTTDKKPHARFLPNSQQEYQLCYNIDARDRFWKTLKNNPLFAKKKSQHYIGDLCRHLSLNQTLNQRISRQGEEKQKEYHIGLIEWIVFNRIQLVLKCLNFILNMIGWFPSSDFKYYDSILTILLAL